MSDNHIHPQPDLQSAGITPAEIKAAMDADFTSKLDETFAPHQTVRSQVVKGLITNIDGEFAIIDIGMKAEGRIPLKEFIEFGKEEAEIEVGQTVDVYVENLDDRHGEAQLSREKARREEVLDDLERVHAKEETVEGIIFGRVKGGFMVDVQGILGFMPGSQLDARPIMDVNPYMYTPLEMMIVKLERERNNVIVSRRAVMDKRNAGTRDELLNDMHEGQVLEGVVKNITDFGAFIDLGGVDGLLHITDIAWHRIGHPSEVIKLGQTLELKVVRFDEDSKRVSLGLKQLSDDPWTSVNDTYPIGAKVKGKVTNITDYGAFVELAPGVEGLIHVSEMSWTRKNVHPGKIVSTSEEVEVMVLEIDHDKRRISLGLKQVQSNPWEAFAEQFKVGQEVSGQVRSVTDFGVFVGLTDDIDGLIHVSDLSWDKSGEEALADYRKGDTVSAKVLTIDPEKERVALGVKQLSNDPFTSFAETNTKGDILKVNVTDVSLDGLTVDASGIEVFIKKRDLAVERDQQDPQRFKEGETIDAKLVNISTKDRRVVLSIRALEIDEEREAVAEFASDEGGTSTLADALGSALKSSDTEEAKPAKKAAAKKSTAKKAAKKDDDAEAKSEEASADAAE